MITVRPSGLSDLVPHNLGVSEWHVIEQKRIDLFADATDDHQWIHVDPERAVSGDFGGTIAHGYLVLSLIPTLLAELLAFEGVKQEINYGIDRLRFTAPVRTDSRIRLAAELTSVEQRGALYVYRISARVEVEAEERPAIVADLLFSAM